MTRQINTGGIEGEQHAGKMAQNYMGNSGGTASIGAFDDIPKLAFELFYIPGSTAFRPILADIRR